MFYKFLYETQIVVYVQLYTKIIMVKNINYNINNSDLKEKSSKNLQNIDIPRKMYLVWFIESCRDKNSKYLCTTRYI